MAIPTFDPMIRMRNRGLVLKRLQWLAWVLFFFQVFGSYFQSHIPLWPGLAQALSVTIGCMLIVYGNVFWLVPGLYTKGKKPLYAAAVLLLLIVVTAARVELSAWIYYRLVAKAPWQPSPLNAYLNVLAYNLVIYIASILFRLALDYFALSRKQQLLQQYALEMELNLLKAQVQPHFLFNTLNNIYYVAQRESPQTAVLLAKLSNIMRYFVDEAPVREASLETEINFIRDYIDLERMRMRYPLQTDILLEGDTAAVRIPPMLLIPLVENVFKHGINKRSAENILQLHLQVQADSLSVQIRNRLSKQEMGRSGGTGLQNLRARLQLLYADRFRLMAAGSEGYFIVSLHIPLL